MESYVRIVGANIREVGRELYDKETGIHTAIWGVGDHSDGDLWLQTNEFTSDNQTLDRQIKGMTLTHGGDEPEAYECAFSELAKAASEVKIAQPNSKVATIFIGDSVPHGMEGGYDRDDGCPKQVDYKQSLAHLKAVSDIFYFVGCSEEERMTRLQKKLVDPQSPNEKFIQLGNMVEDLPQLLIASIKLTRDIGSFGDYLKQLPGDQAGRIAGYLGSGK